MWNPYWLPIWNGYPKFRVCELVIAKTSLKIIGKSSETLSIIMYTVGYIQIAIYHINYTAKLSSLSSTEISATFKFFYQQPLSRRLLWCHVMSYYMSEQLGHIDTTQCNWIGSKWLSQKLFGTNWLLRYALNGVPVSRLFRSKDIVAKCQI